MSALIANFDTFNAIFSDIYSGSIYDEMAGAGFDCFYAGNSAYSAPNLPSANLKSVFIDRGEGLNSLLYSLNENFASYVLVSFATLLSKEDSRAEAGQIAKDFEAIAKAYNEGDKEYQDVLKPSQTQSISNFTDMLAKERQKTGSLKNALKTVGMLKYGVLGGMAGGVVADLITDGELNFNNIAVTLTDMMASEAISSVVKVGIKALGMAPTSLAGIATMGVLGGIMAELVGVALGYDVSFGFGGSLTKTTNDLNQPLYDMPVGIAEGLKGLVGFGMGVTGLISSIESYRATGQIEGVRIGSYERSFQIGDDVRWGGRKDGGMKEISKEEKERMDKDLGYMREIFKNSSGNKGRDHNGKSSSERGSFDRDGRDPAGRSTGIRNA